MGILKGGGPNVICMNGPDAAPDRNQFFDVIDVTKTILHVCELPEPSIVNSIEQAPFEGVSMKESFNNANAPEVHTLQYFEMMGNRGIYHEGWTACTKHRTPWSAATPCAFDEDVWELYGPDDWTQSKDIAKENPKKLAELQQLWLIEATKYNVIPLDDRGFERVNPQIAGRPELVKGNSQTLFQGMRVAESAVLMMRNKSHTVTAEIELNGNPGNGVIVTQGGEAGGWSMYLKDGKLKYCYNFFGIEQYIISAEKPVPSGKHEIRMEFKYDGGGLAKGGNVKLTYDGEVVGKGRVEKTQPMGFSADEACDVGADSGSPASPEYGSAGNKFTGMINWVKLEVGDDDHNHLVSAEDKLNMAMAKH